MKKLTTIIPIVLIFIGFALTSCGKKYTLFVGGFTEKEGDKGFTVYDFNSRTGDFKLLSQSDVGPSPSYFCYSGKNKNFYILNEVMEFRGQFGGGLSTFKFDRENNQLTKQNEILIPYAGPCYISLSDNNGYLFIANYPNGSVAVVKLSEGGIPGTVSDTILYNKAEPDASHAHMIISDPGGKYVYVTDLGLDRIVTYDFDNQSGKLNQLTDGITSVPRRFGPRHFVFNSDGSKLYVICELGSKMLVFDVNENGSLSLIQTLSTLREGFGDNNYCADIHISSDGKYLYGSNRGENTIVTYRVGEDGMLTLAGHVSCGGNWPRNFVIDPSGKYLLVGNQKSNYISVLKIDRKTGLPGETVKNVNVNAPACLKFY